MVRGLVGGAPPWSILETRDATADGPSTEASGPLGGHRRQLTALCCRLRVRGASTVDGEALDDRIRGAIGLCADVARRHGGHVASALGDDLLFYFGYPRAAEDDARRAARAALAMAEAVAAEGDRSPAAERGSTSASASTPASWWPGAPPLGGATLVVGATPRLAAALAALAEPGSVAASAEAHALLRASFEVEAAGARAIDGTDAGRGLPPRARARRRDAGADPGGRDVAARRPRARDGIACWTGGARSGAAPVSRAL